MSSVFEISIIIIFLVLIGILLWRFYINYEWYSINKRGSLYRTTVANANTEINNPLSFTNTTKGTSLELTAPKGYNIKISQIYVGGMPAPSDTDYDPNSNPNYSSVNCWSALSKSGIGYPLSGEQAKDTVYIKALRKLQLKYDGNNSVTIPSNDEDLMSIVEQFFLRNAPSSSSQNLSACDVAFTSDSGSLPWTPLVVCLYECIKN